MSQKHINIKVEVDPALTCISADPAKLKQVLYNYLSNALKFTLAGGKVTVRARPEDTEHYRIEVEDSGIGIKPEDTPRLFVEFQQLDASTAKMYQGTGLGLALTKRIVEAQAGRVGMSSVYGQGSVFYAVLPRAMRPGSEDAVPVLPVSPWEQTAAPQILIVDDDPKDRAWLQQLLQHEGYQIEVASKGEQALNLCRARRYDAILLDILLPDISGREVLEVVRTHGPNQKTPVIIVSVTVDASVIHAFTVQDYLVKPVSREVLLQALEMAHINPGQHDRILVVDDDPNALKLMSKSLTDLGYRPLTAATSEQALDFAQRGKPDAVILDLLMPGMDGFEFLRLFRLLDGCADVPVIVWTGKDITSFDRKQLQNAAQAIVAKGSQQGVTPLLDELRKYLLPPIPPVPPSTPPPAVVAAAKSKTAHKRTTRGERHGG